MDALYRLRDGETGRVVLQRVQIADTFWRRLIGLLGRRSLDRDEGLLLRRCRSVHTCGMRFPIDVALLDAEQVVLRVYSAVPPWRFVMSVKSACMTLEGAAGALAGLEGRRLLLELSGKTFDTTSPM
jgi:uncharacterized membrane protein (UPF0127 family)